MESIQELETRIQGFREEGLQLDLTRGKPGPEQLDIASDILSSVDKTNYSAGSVDTRNYGGLDGIPEAKSLFAEYMGVDSSEVIVGGNSSLALMHDTMAQLATHGSAIAGKPWTGRDLTFICPVPGYDRHFTLCQRFGIKMVTVPMTPTGPDMDEVEKIAASDPSVVGMWCVPRYSNPTGYTCSAETVTRLANMKTAADDFIIMWDDAYAVHYLGNGPDPLESILTACKNAGNPERVILFASTSKISFAGAGLAVTAGSAATCDWARERLFAQTIGNDKINMLRHVRFFGDMNGILDHMKKHAAIVGPKFKAVEEILERELGGLGAAEWTKPTGGYFVSLDTGDGLASEVVRLAAEVGVKLTPAGATFPYKKDPRDRNIRIAPTFPSLTDVEKAVEVLAVCIKYATAKKA